MTAFAPQRGWALARAWAPAVAWMAVMFGGSTDFGSSEHTAMVLEPLLRFLVPGLSPATFELLHAAIRKAAHLAEYAILAALLFRALLAAVSKLPGASRWRAALMAWLMAAAFAASDEFHQSFVPSREPAPRDVLVDIVGAGMGLSIALLVRRIRSDRNPGRR